MTSVGSESPAGTAAGAPVPVGEPTPIGRRLPAPDGPPLPPPAPPPPPPPPPVTRAPGAAPESSGVDHDTPPEGMEPVAGRRRPRRSATSRRARLYLYRVDSWSVMKVAFMLAVATAVVLITAVAAVWWALDYSGTFATLARNVDEVIGSGTTTFDLLTVLAFDRVMGVTIVVAALEIALVSVMAGLFAILYNLTVGITGGVEITFSDSV